MDSDIGASNNLRISAYIEHNGEIYHSTGIDMSESYNNESLKLEEFEMLFNMMRKVIKCKIRELNAFVDYPTGDCEYLIFKKNKE